MADIQGKKFIENLKATLAGGKLTDAQAARIRKRITLLEASHRELVAKQPAIMSAMQRGSLTNDITLIVEFKSASTDERQKRDGSGSVTITKIVGTIVHPFNHLAESLKDYGSVRLADNYRALVLTNQLLAERPYILYQGKRLFVTHFDVLPNAKVGDYLELSGVTFQVRRAMHRGESRTFTDIKVKDIKVWRYQPTALQRYDMHRQLSGGQNMVLRPIDSRYLPTIVELNEEAGITPMPYGADAGHGTSEEIAELEDSRQNSQKAMQEALKRLLPKRIPESHPMREYLLGWRNLVHVIEPTDVEDMDGLSDDCVAMNAPMWSEDVLIEVSEGSRRKNPDYAMPHRLMLRFTQQGRIFGENAIHRISLEGTIFHNTTVNAFGIGWVDHAKLLYPVLLGAGQGIAVRAGLSAENTMRMGLNFKNPKREAGERVWGLSLSCYDVYADMPRILRTVAYEVTATYAVRCINNWLQSHGIKVYSSNSANCSKLSQVNSPMVQTMLKQNKMSTAYGAKVCNCFESNITFEVEDDSMRYFALTNDQFGGELRKRIDNAVSTYYYDADATPEQRQAARARLDEYRDLCSAAFSAADGNQPLPDGVEMDRGDNRAMVIYMVHRDLDDPATTTYDMSRVMSPLSELDAVPTVKQVLEDVYGKKESDGDDDDDAAPVVPHADAAAETENNVQPMDEAPMDEAPVRAASAEPSQASADMLSASLLSECEDTDGKLSKPTPPSTPKKSPATRRPLFKLKRTDSHLAAAKAANKRPRN